jgi:dihydrofolate synthase/folylpolyglutamate synthase
MQYSEAIDWLFQQFPSYQNIGKSAYKPDLGNIEQLCEILQINHSHLKYIHVAGTNGKGSTSNMLSSILMEAGYKVGTFTSPHLIDFRERIAINDTLIPEGNVVSFCKLVQEQNLSFEPSFFEITFAMALKHFIETNCDICVIETGLGGRLDATNIITPILSVITNISLDHTDLLGDTLPKIALEKAGIIKKNIPVVIGEFHPETIQIFKEKAIRSKSTIHLAFEEFELEETNNYKYINERTVKCCIKQLHSLGFIISENHTKDGILNLTKNRNFVGRFQLIQQNPQTIIDVSHNEAGLKKTFELLKKIERGGLHIIFGASSDKNLTDILPIFPQNASYYFTVFSSNRSCTKQELIEKTRNTNLNILFFDSLEETTKYTKNIVNKEDTLLITGSFFLISDFIKLFSLKRLQK